MKYHFKMHRSKKGFWAEGVELPGCKSQGDSVEELRKNLSEALDLFLEEPPESPICFPLPDSSIIESKSILQVRVSSRVAFAFLLKRMRLSHELSQREVAESMGFKNLYSYQRLESAEKANPALETICKIKQVFPEFSLDAVVE